MNKKPYLFKFHLTLPLLLILTLTSSSIYAGMNGPKPTNPTKLASKETTLATEAAKFGVRFFQAVISPLDGPRSPSYPTGSAYGLSSIKKHGAFWGILLTADRLFHEADQPLGPITNFHGQDRYFDPVFRNDFWLN